MRYIKNILLTLALAGTLSSCVSEVDDVFDKLDMGRISNLLGTGGSYRCMAISTLEDITY